MVYFYETERQLSMIKIGKAESHEEISEGLYSITEDLYRSYPALNHSNLQNLFPPKTPADYIWGLNNPRKATDAMNFGNAIHLAVFEPDTFDDRVAIMPELDRRTKVGKEEYLKFSEENAGKIFLSQGEFDGVFNIMNAAQKHSSLAGIFRQKGYPETSGFFEYMGISMKFKIDYFLNSGIIIDLKTTQTGHERAFRNSVLDWNYHTQAEFYMMGMELLTGQQFDTFVWVVVEKFPPYKIYLYEPAKRWLDLAKSEISSAIDLYLDCKTRNYWPGVPETVQTLDVPRWLEERE
jgi:hypothetical protein